MAGVADKLAKGRLKRALQAAVAICIDEGRSLHGDFPQVSVEEGLRRS